VSKYQLPQWRVAEVMPTHGYKMPSEDDLRRAKASGSAIVVERDGKRTRVPYPVKVAS